MLSHKPLSPEEKTLAVYSYTQTVATLLLAFLKGYYNSDINSIPNELLDQIQMLILLESVLARVFKEDEEALKKQVEEQIKELSKEKTFH